VSLNQADFGKKGPTEKCRKVFKQGKKQAKRSNEWKGQFPFFGKGVKGIARMKKRKPKSAAEKKHESCISPPLRKIKNILARGKWF
jgi:hypothetical protein